MSDAPCHNCGMPLGAHGALHHCAMYLADESDPRDEEITRLRAEVERLREHLRGLVGFNDMPMECKRPDVFALLIRDARQALQGGVNGPREG